MATVENHQISSLLIDLNIPLESEHEYIGEEQLPNLTVDAYTIPDLNLISGEEDDTQLSVEFQASLEEPNQNSDANEGLSQLKRTKNLSSFELTAVYEMLLTKIVDGKLKRGVIKTVATEFSICTKTVQRIWKRSNYGEGTSETVRSRKPKKSGHKKLEIDLDQIRNIPLRNQTTLESLACAMNVDKSTLTRLFQSGAIKRHSNAIKPHLKEENKRARLRFFLSMLEDASIPHNPVFMGMYNIVHIDKKWFNMMKTKENYYLLPDEEAPLRTCKSKNFIPKVMFLAAVARPRFDAHGKETFSGKIGVFPFITHERAKRASVNRSAGTLETKPVTSVTRDISRSYLIEKIIPSIKAKWPREDLNLPIFIQQDNARTHIHHDDEEFCRVATQDRFDIRLMSQPPNSPDLNVLDLGFFRAIHSLQYKESPTTIDELVTAVTKSYEIFSTTKSNNIFLTLQSCMIETMKVNGSHYKIPHLSKAMLQKKGQLPTELRCDHELVQEVLSYLGGSD